MTVDKIINMVVKMITRKVLNRGINAGMNVIGGSGKGADGQSAADRELASENKKAVRRARQAAKIGRKIGRL